MKSYFHNKDHPVLFNFIKLMEHRLVRGRIQYLVHTTGTWHLVCICEGQVFGPYELDDTCLWLKLGLFFISAQELWKKKKSEKMYINFGTFALENQNFHFRNIDLKWRKIESTINNFLWWFYFKFGKFFQWEHWKEMIVETSPS